jgi:hypothetical protein
MDTRHAGAAVEESKKNDENPRVQRESQDRARGSAKRILQQSAMT